jgi:hypothetical protein
MIDSGADLDLEAVLQNIGEAEIVGVFFPNLDRTLLVDTRSSLQAGQMVRIVPMAKNSGDRLRSVQRLRPQFPRPSSITLIPWVRKVDSLLPLGVWPALLERLIDDSEAYECLDVLRELEERELRDAIVGHQYRTLWQRSPAAFGR